MPARGVPLETIEEYTGLGEDDIVGIKSDSV
jgi:hypothetical protein